MSITLQLKFVRLPVFDAAVKVSTAVTDCPADSTVFCWFQLRVSEEAALAGLQVFVVIVSVSGTLPVFLM